MELIQVAASTALRLTIVKMLKMVKQKMTMTKPMKVQRRDEAVKTKMRQNLKRHCFQAKTLTITIQPRIMRTLCLN